MKNIIYLLILVPFLTFSQTNKTSFGGEFKFNPDKIPCITEEAKAKIDIQIKANLTKLEKQGKIKKNSEASLTRPSFIWPVKKADNSSFNDVWAISNYVDHNSSFPDKLQDYNCGTRTYDTNNGYNHKGVDIYSWPFSWYQFQNNLSEVVAAAPGTIIFKRDGQFDMNCDFNSDRWNAIYVRHSDNSVAWYGHLKNGSLNSKNVGDTVSEGEYLGVIGSSGNSTGPHLHFEVYDSNSNLIDPFSGTCSSNVSWWKEQPSYYSSNVNAALAHNSPPAFNTCPNTETTNITDQFLPNTFVYLAGYFKDQVTGTTANFKLSHPNGQVENWSKTFSNTYTSSYWYWRNNNLSNLGTYTFEIEYLGKKATTTFKVVSTLNIENDILESFKIISNPVNKYLKITSGNINPKEYSLHIYNQLGQQVLTRNTFSNNLDVQFLANGLYLVQVKNKSKNSIQSFKIIKE
ncbi:MAG: peptidoglycan DD-metalloendopeptidase family protein [Polaribacter sp.]